MRLIEKWLVGTRNQPKLSAVVFLCAFLITSFSFIYFTDSISAAQGIHQRINFQGKLVDEDGVNVANGSYSILFTLYNDPSAGTNLWDETQTVTVTDGIFRVSLGDVDTTLGNVNFNSDLLYLGVKVEADAEMTPRIRFTTVPYAFNAKQFAGLTSTSTGTSFNISGGTDSAVTLTVAGANITVGSTITPTSSGGLTVISNGANTLNLDTGGAASLSIGALNSNGVSISKAGTTTTVNGGLTVVAGQNITFNNDVLTDFTGVGLTVSGGALQVDLLSASNNSGSTASFSGLELIGNEIALLQGCEDAEVLAWDTTRNVWDCATAAAGSGDITAVGNIDTGAAFTLAAPGSNLFVADTGWIGIGTGGGRIYFDDAGTDILSFLDSNVGIGTTNVTGAKFSVIGGSVGINTTSPTQTLDVAGTIRAGTDVYIGSIALGGSDTNTTSGAFVVGVNDDFTYSNSTKVQSVLKDLDSALGNLLIGNSGLWADGGIYAYLNTALTSGMIGNPVSAGANKLSSMYLTDTAPVVFGLDNDFYMQFNGTNLTIGDTTNTFLAIGDSVATGNFNFNNNQLYLRGDGRVGIGTTAPAGLLHISDETNPGLVIVDTTNTVSTFMQSNDSSGLMGTSSAHGLALLTQSQTRMFLNSTGQVGIGTILQNDLLEVAGGITIGAGYTGSAVTAPSNGLLVQGTVGIGVTNPTAILDLLGSSTSQASLRLRSGVAPSAPNEGEVYADGLTVFYRKNDASWLDLGATSAGGAVTLITGDGVGVTGSGSGLELEGSNVGLLQGCANTEILKWDETASAWECSADATGSGSLSIGVSVNTYSTIGAGTWPKPANFLYAQVIVVGAGGGGGGADSSDGSSSTGGGGGGGGGYSEEWFDDAEISGSSAPFLVGAGGIGGSTAGGNGGIGGSSTFGIGILLDGKGGGGGLGASQGAVSHALAGGAGGVATGGDINIQGGAGFPGSASTAASAIAGSGGNSYIGAGGSAPVRIAAGTGPGVAGVGFGGGGSGAVNINGTTGPPGGAGANGVVIVKSYIGSIGADLAEMYGTRDIDMKAGDVVSLDPELGAGVKKSGKPYDPSVVGIISTQPGLLIGSVEDEGARGVPVALSGRVPVNVNDQNGPIKKGDLLTSSSTPGVAMKATKAGQIIGQAMTDFNGTEIGKVIVFIKTDVANGASLRSMYEGLVPSVTVTQHELGKLALINFINQKEQLETTLDLSEITTDRIAAGLDIISPRLVSDELLIQNIFSSSEGIGISIHSDVSILGDLSVRKIRVEQIEGLQLPFLPVDNKDSSTSAVLAFKFPRLSYFEGVVEFLNSVLFKKEVEFSDKVAFNTDTAGEAIIKSGANSVEVQFEKPFKEKPLISTNLIINDDLSKEDLEATENQLLGADLTYIITKRSERGFTIKLNKPAPSDIRFSWMVTYVKKPKVSDGTIETPPEVTVTIEPTQEPTVIPTIEAIPTQTSIPTTEPTIEPTEVLSPTITDTIKESATNE